MPCLILAEHDNAALAASTRHAVTAALQIGGDVHVLVAGDNCAAAAAQAAAIQGVAKVLVAEARPYRWPLPENIAPLLASLASAYTHILTPATTTGKDIMPRAAALLGVSQVSDIVQVIDAHTYMRPIYAGNALETVRSGEAVQLVTVRQSAFAAAAAEGGNAPVEQVAAAPASALAECIGVTSRPSERPELTSARIVVSGGRGIGSAENFKLLEAFADKLGAAVGASRAAVDAGFVPNDYQVGQTGKVVAPDLYIAVGISGAIQHLAGMKDSKVIVAINKDENAPIFDIADYGLVADWQEALPNLEKLLTQG